MVAAGLAGEAIAREVTVTEGAEGEGTLMERDFFSLLGGSIWNTFSCLPPVDPFGLWKGLSPQLYFAATAALPSCKGGGRERACFRAHAYTVVSLLLCYVVYCAGWPICELRLTGFPSE